MYCQIPKRIFRGKKNPQKHEYPVNSDRRVFCDGLDLGMTDLKNSVVFIFAIGNTKTVRYASLYKCNYILR